MSEDHFERRVYRIFLHTYLVYILGIKFLKVRSQFEESDMKISILHKNVEIFLLTNFLIDSLVITQ